MNVPNEVVFYCMECEKIIDVPVKNTFKPPCPNDAAHRAISFGSERSIKNFYKIKDDKFDAERAERIKKAMQADKL